MNRRQFTFWVGFGLFTLSEKLGMTSLDCLAAGIIRRSRGYNSSNTRSAVTETVTETVNETKTAEHWIPTGDDEWFWFEREDLILGRWRLTGTTVPINKTTGQRKPDSEVYLEDSLVPAEMWSDALGGVVLASHEEVPADQVVAELNKQLPTETIRHRQGKPPSEWLRSLEADEIRIWLDTIDVPTTGVRHMTHWTHLTRDHSFDPLKIEGLTIPEQAKLHSAAHFGY